MNTRSVRLLAAVGVALSLAACGGSDASPDQGGDGPITVVASTNVWADVAAAIGGSEVAVSSIIADPNADPHSYEVNAKDAATVRGAKLVVYNGGGYDSWVEQSLDKGSDQRRVVAFDLRITKDGDNEHVWYDLPTVVQVANDLAAKLTALKPAAKATFIANSDTFVTKVSELQDRTSALGAAHPGTQVAATEPVAHYLLAAAGLADATPAEFTNAVEDETEPPAGAVAQVRSLVSERKVALLVHNPQTETPVVTDLLGAARQANVPVVDLTESLPSGLDYLTWMGKQIDALSAALSRP